MKRWLQRCGLASLPWVMLAGFSGGWGSTCAKAVPVLVEGQTSIESVSGQFVVYAPADPTQFRLPDNLAISGIRLQPPWLAITAERVKAAVWQSLGVSTSEAYQGNIFLALHPAHSWNEPVPIAVLNGQRGWNYRVDLPDALPKYLFVRSLVSVVLFELAEHNNLHPASPPELPAWLVDGLTRKIISDQMQDLVISAPNQMIDHLAQTRVVAKLHGSESTDTAHQLLRASAPLTFSQLSWPTTDQLNGDDGGAYQASAQVFVTELAKLPGGAARLHLFLNQLPGCQNWQTAFQTAYQPVFATPLDVEKWWSLRLVDFSMHDPGPAWAADVSRQKLDEILRVPVQIRANSNSLPTFASLSLQEAIRRVNYSQQDGVLSAKARELGLAQFRLTPPLAKLAHEYRQAIFDYLGQSGDIQVAQAGRSVRKKAGAPDTIRKLNQLDNQRAMVEAGIKPVSLQALKY